MLEVNHLTRLYGRYKAVDDVGFSIKQGEIVGLLGHNGAGKTTIMKMISGYLEPDQGAVSIDGIDLQQSPELAKQKIGYLPEQLPVYDDMTVAEYLDFAASLKNLSGKAKQTAIRNAVQATGLQPKFISEISSLSRGFKQRVGVAQAILGDPKLLILDEPTNGLDPKQTEQMRGLIRKIAQHATVILSTHIMQEVEALCSRVLIINGGKLALDNQLSDLSLSHAWLLETSLNPEYLHVLNAVEGIDTVTLIDSNKGRLQYRLTIQTEQTNTFDSNLVAQAVHQHNAALYSLNQEKQDLETLFKDVNEGKLNPMEVKHAA